MAYKEVSRVQIAEVIRQWQAGRGIREITRSTGLSRNTIRKYLLTAQNCGLARDGPPPTESQLLTLVQLNRAGLPKEKSSTHPAVFGPTPGNSLNHTLASGKESSLKKLRLREPWLS